MQDFLMSQVLDGVQGTTIIVATGSRLTLVKNFTWVLLLPKEAGLVLLQILSCFTLTMKEHGKRTRMDMVKNW